ncbi:MAG: hypothetical protein U1D30_16930 [Planctomycetota bacterium]
MSIELSADTNAFIEKLVAEGHFPDRRHALDHAVELLREETETLRDITEGLASVDRGEGVPAIDAMDALRRKYKIPEDA